jgi:hypothetical protein
VAIQTALDADGILWRWASEDRPRADHAGVNPAAPAVDVAQTNGWESGDGTRQDYVRCSPSPPARLSRGARCGQNSISSATASRTMVLMVKLVLPRRTLVM